MSKEDLLEFATSTYSHGEEHLGTIEPLFRQDKDINAKAFSRACTTFLKQRGLSSSLLDLLSERELEVGA